MALITDRATRGEAARGSRGEHRPTPAGEAQPLLGACETELTDALAREIRIDCHRALRRLDALIGERNDVLLHQVRALVRHASDLAAAHMRANHAANGNARS